MDGEAVVTGEDGIGVLDALHPRHKAADAMGKSVNPDSSPAPPGPPYPGGVTVE
jgi:hypothetical protein